MKCPEGYIQRSAYSRKTKTGKTVKVKAACILSRGEKSTKRTDIDKKIMAKLKKIHSRARKMFGTPVCKKGEILREGYKKKSYITKRGTKVDEIWVKPVCIKSPTGRSKGKQLFVLSKSGLSSFGYKNVLELSTSERHRTLQKALREKNPLSVYRRLVALSTLNKNKNPKLSKLLKQDSDWVKTTKEYKSNMASSIKKSPKKPKKSMRKSKKSMRKSPKKSKKTMRKSKKTMRKSKKSMRKSPKKSKKTMRKKL